MTTKIKPKRIVIDTSLWLLACARKTVGDKMSRIDRQLNETSISQNPKKYRGALARLLVQNKVIVPTKVLDELKAIIQTGILDRSETGNLGKLVHNDNKQDIQFLIDAMEGLTTPVIPTRAQVLRQAAIWERIKMMPSEEKRWRTKFEPSEQRVRRSAQKAKGIGEEPWLTARKEWLARLDALEQDPSPQLAKETKNWEEKMKETWPDLIPDYEILLVAEAANAPVASRDNDYLLMWMGSTELTKKPETRPIIVRQITDIQDPEISPQKFGLD
jgi:hypothetical protein